MGQHHHFFRNTRDQRVDFLWQAFDDIQLPTRRPSSPLLFNPAQNGFSPACHPKHRFFALKDFTAKRRMIIVRKICRDWRQGRVPHFAAPGPFS